MVKNLPANAGDARDAGDARNSRDARDTRDTDPGFDSRVMKIPWNRKWHPTPVFLPGKFHRQRRIVGCSPWICKESNMTERLNRHTV